MHAPLTCASIIKDAVYGDHDDERPHQHHELIIRCTGEAYNHVRRVAGGDAVLILEENAALKRLVMYGIWHSQASAAVKSDCKIQNGTSSSSSSSASTLLSPSSPFLADNSNLVISSIRKGSGGLGNVLYSMIVGLVIATYSSNRRLYATMYSDKAWKRYGGLFSAAVDDAFLDHRHHQHHDNHDHLQCPQFEKNSLPSLRDDDFWPPSFMKYAAASGDQLSEKWIEAPISHTIVCSRWSEYHALSMVVAQPVAPAVTLLSVPAGATILRELGDNLVTFMSHFLITPAPGLRMEIQSIVNGMRRSSTSEPEPFVIGIHMRWAHESQVVFESPFHAQYVSRVGLSSSDFDAFVDAAYALAEGHARVVFFIASDSLIRLLNLQEALSRPERGWSVVTANVLTNVSDGATADSVVDLFVLSMCDDLIVSHTSTFSHLAAALGGHRPVLISAELSFKFGRRPLRRSRTLDWTMPTDSWATFTMDLPYESWMSGGMSYGAQNHARQCQGISEEEAAAAVDVAASSFVDVDRRQ